MPAGDPTNPQTYAISSDMTAKLVDGWGVLVIYNAPPSRSIAALPDVVLFDTGFPDNEIYLTKAQGAEVPGTVVTTRPGPDNGRPPQAPARPTP